MCYCKPRLLDIDLYMELRCVCLDIYRVQLVRARRICGDRGSCGLPPSGGVWAKNYVGSDPLTWRVEIRRVLLLCVELFLVVCRDECLRG